MMKIILHKLPEKERIAELMTEIRARMTFNPKDILIMKILIIAGHTMTAMTEAMTRVTWTVITTAMPTMNITAEIYITVIRMISDGTKEKAGRGIGCDFIFRPV
jgi:hypothetical protein